MSGRRPRSAALVALTLLLAVAAVATTVVVRRAPARARATLEQRLGEALGPVRVGSVDLALGLGLGLEARDVRTESGRLAAARLVVMLDPAQLVRGRVRVGRVTVEGLRAELERTPTGELLPEPLGRWFEQARAAGPAVGGEAAPSAGGKAAESEAARPLAARLAEAWESARALPAVALEDLLVRVQEVDASGAPVGPPLELRDARAVLRRSGLRRTLELAATGELARGDASGGRLSAAVSVPSDGRARAALDLDDLDLALPGPWLAGRGEAPALAGRVRGRIDGHLTAEEAGTLEVDLTGRELRLRRRGPDARWSGASLVASLALAPGELAARSLELRADALALSGEARVDLPWSDRSRVDLALRAAPLDAAALRELARTLLPEGAEDARRVAAALESGRFGPLVLRAQATRRARLEAFLRDPLEAWPRDLSIELGLQGVGARLGEGEPLGELDGRLEGARDRIDLAVTRARLGDRPLPELELRLEGVAAVAAALEQGAIPAPVPPLPGRLALTEWIDSVRKPGSPPRWQRAELEAERIAHPALLRALEDVRATLRPGSPGIHAEVSQARWGGVPVTGHVDIRSGPRPRIEARVAASEPPARPAPGGTPSAGGEWAVGRVRVELEKLGPLRASSLVGRVRAVGHRAELRGGDAVLVPRGRLTGDVDVDFSRREAVPYAARLRIEGGSLPDLMTDVGLPGDWMTGSADLSGRLDGRLLAGHKVLAEVSGPASMRLREGEIRQRMHLMLAIAAASDTLNPFRSRETLPFHAIDAELELERGTIRAKSMSLTGPAVRLVATGSVDAVESPYALEAVLGVFFFRSLDTVISKVPLVNRLLLGSDENLMAAYFALSGPWADPRARVIPVKTLLTTGPAGIVTEGLPAFVRSGLSTLERLLGGGGDEGGAGDDDPAAPAEAPP